MDAAEHDEVRKGLLLVGFMDAISLGEVHTTFMCENRAPNRPLHEAQQLTLNVIRELVSEDLFVLGVPNKKDPTGFTQWDLPLEAAMARIEEAYVKNFDDRWGWTTFVWMKLTDKGKKLASKLYDEIEPWP